MTPPFHLVGEGGTKVPTVRLDHASPQAVCRDTRLAQLSPACSPGLAGSSGHPLCGRTALRSLLLSAHGHQGGDTPQRPDFNIGSRTGAANATPVLYLFIVRLARCEIFADSSLLGGLFYLRGLLFPRPLPEGPVPPPWPRGHPALFGSFCGCAMMGLLLIKS
jgi:hypothetical protein